MSKPWPTLTICALCAFAWLQGGFSFAQEKSDGILFLNLRRDDNGVTLLRADSRPGQLKPQVGSGSLEFEVSSEGAVVHSGVAADPLLQMVEFPDASEPGKLRTEIITHESAEFSLRLPATTVGQKLQFFRRATLENGRLKALATRELLGEMTIPAVQPLMGAFANSASFHTLLTNGPTRVRLNIAILAEGFTDSQETTFTNRARTVLNQFLAVSPYKEYRNHFNGFAIFVPSVQSGSDHPASSTYRNTYFNSSYGTGGLVRLITIPPNNFNSSYSAGVGKVHSLLEQFLPEYDIVLLLVNDSEYGGSGGFPAVASIHSSSSELALHEIAHSFADLADEYDSATPGYPEIEKANTTRETRRDFIKWRDWINPSTPIPTAETATYANAVGLFEGAYFHENDWYRPKLNCRMNTLGVEFCEVCKETIVLAAYTRLQAIHSSSPIENNLLVPGGGELLLRVETVSPVQSRLNYAWTIDGVTNSAFTSNTFPASFATLGVGRRLVRSSVNDPTHLVRADPLGKLWKTRSWLVHVPAETNLPPQISAFPDQNVDPGALWSLDFTVLDPDNPVDSLQLSIQSSNTNIIANSDIRVEGSGTNRVLLMRATSNCDHAGTTTITLTASDGSITVSTSFLVHLKNEDIITIEPIPDYRVFTGPLTIPVQLDFGACEHDLSLAGSSSDTSILPQNGIIFDGSAGSRTLRLQPVPGSTGSVLVKVSATDGSSLATTSFTVLFLKEPRVLATVPEFTPNGILLQFNSDAASSMVLEHSPDFRFWTPVTSVNGGTSLDHVIPSPALGVAGFYRVRLLPL
jgi:hypothetical protein